MLYPLSYEGCWSASVIALGPNQTAVSAQPAHSPAAIWKESSPHGARGICQFSSREVSDGRFGRWS